MTVPFAVPFDPPKQPYGRSAKELLGYGGRFGQNTKPPIVVLPFNALTGFGFRMVAQPAAPTFYGWLNRPWYDASWATHVRLVTDINVAGATGAYFELQYCTDETAPDDDTKWDMVGAIRPCRVLIDRVLDDIGPQRGARAGLRMEVKKDRIYRVVAVGGNGATSPEHGLIWAEFEYRKPLTPDRWYWRTDAPWDANPNNDGATFYEDFDGSGGAPQATWVTPTPSTVTSNQGTLQQIKGNAETGLAASSVDEHKDYSGILLRFMGAPLKAQIIPPFTYKHGFSAVHGSGGVIGSYLHFRIGVYRPSTTTELIVWSSSSGETQSSWFRYAEKQRIVSVEVDEEFEVQAGDRMFLDVIGFSQVASGISTTNGLGISVAYNGSNDAFVNGDDAGSMSSASWTEFPLLQYINKDPRVQP